MPIDLSDIPTAVGEYLDTHVTTVVSAVSSGGTIEEDEIGEFTVTVTNAAAPDGVRLINVRYHLTVSPGSVAKFQTDSSALMPQRPTIDPSSPAFGFGDLTEEMFLFPNSGFLTQAELNVGEVAVIEGLNVKALGVGSATIKCHIHADIDQDSLFPNSQNSPNGRREFSVT